jgi:hypothetical protein
MHKQLKAESARHAQANYEVVNDPDQDEDASDADDESDTPPAQVFPRAKKRPQQADDPMDAETLAARVAMYDSIAHRDPTMKAAQARHRERVTAIKASDPYDADRVKAALREETHKYAVDLGILGVDDDEHQRDQEVSAPASGGQEAWRGKDKRPLKPLKPLPTYSPFALRRASVTGSWASAPGDYCLRAGPAVQQMASGQPSKLFRKELIHTGHFEKKSDGLEFDVTRELLAHWALTAKRFLAAGNRIPCPSGHTDDPSQNKG